MEKILNDEAMMSSLADCITERILQRLKDYQPVKRWLSMSEACEYAGKSRNTIRLWIDEGYIHAQKTTGHWEIDRESIDDWFKSDVQI